MIYFNGTSLESVAPVKIEDIRVSPIAQMPVTRENPLKAGATFIRAHEGTRTVQITFAVLEQDYYQRERYLEAVIAWALSSETPAPLQLPYNGCKLLDVICTGLPEPSTRQWWESRLNLTFTAYDPYFYDAAEKSVACGTAFTVYGNAAPKMRITATLAESTSLVYSDGTNLMTFTNVPAGDLVIDLNEQTAQVSTNSVMSAYAFTSRFLLPKTGAQTITGTGTVRWRERWKQ